MFHQDKRRLKPVFALFLSVFLLSAFAAPLAAQQGGDLTPEPAALKPADSWRLGAPLFAGSLGVDFFLYEQVFLSTGFDYMQPIREGLELNLGFAFDISTTDAGADVQASFLFPFDIGLNAIFPGDPVDVTFGAGVTPVVYIPAEALNEETSLYIGPYLKGGLRFQVHPVVQLFVDAQQDLLFGGEEWIYTQTRLSAGIVFDTGS
ncbi:MAG: hypothetical protein K9L68_07005 [Spirochaetales bacterium]|nr:hypothetical protein [Spirochaetales bacterium]MCF7938333.1 hypothetical protein [Spirochaetales bacterium]